MKKKNMQIILNFIILVLISINLILIKFNLIVMIGILVLKLTLMIKIKVYYIIIMKVLTNSIRKAKKSKNDFSKRKAKST